MYVSISVAARPHIAILEENLEVVMHWKCYSFSVGGTFPIVFGLIGEKHLKSWISF